MRDEANFFDVQSPGGIDVLSHLNVKAVEAGEKFSLVLTEEGDVYYFGKKLDKIADPFSNDNITVPTKLEGLPPVQAVSSFYQHALLLTNDGSVYAFGLNEFGQLGLGDNQPRTTPTLVPNLSGISAISAGHRFSLALTNTGQVYAFGNNGEGQLGNGNTVASSTPQLITGFSNVKAISAGLNHSLALLDSGEVYAFGGNNNGQLGLNTTTSIFSTPQKITEPAGESAGWGSAVEAGSLASFVVTSSGKVYAFGGSSPTGQLGLYDPSQHYVYYRKPTPLGLSHVSAVSSSAQHTLFLTDEGSLYGTGFSGNWGTYPSNTLRAPELLSLTDISDIRFISAGYSHSLVIGKTVGKLGQQTAAFNAFRPDKETDLAIDVKRNGNILVSVEDETGILTAGEDYSIVDNQFYLLKSYLTGLGVGEYVLTFRFSYGDPQSLDLSIINKPLSFVLTPDLVFDQNPSLLEEQITDIELELNGNTLSGIKLSYLENAYARSQILAAGTSYTIEGNNVTISKTFLSDFYIHNTSNHSLVFTFSDNTEIAIPVQMLKSNNSRLYQDHIIIERDVRFQGNVDITVELYGNQFLGILNGMTPLSEGSDYWISSPGSNEQQVTISSDYLLTLKGEHAELTFRMDKGVYPKLSVHLLDPVYGEEGLYAFGANFFGQLGFGDYQYRTLPSYMEVLRDQEIREAAAGSFYSMALTSEGDVYAFSGIFQELGDEEEPIALFENLPAIASISASGEHALLLSEAGDVYGWGYNQFGQLGSEPASEQDYYVIAPVKIEGLSGIKAVAAGGVHSLALTEDGEVYVFGRNDFGQLGVERSPSPNASNYLAVPALLENIPEIAAIAAGPGHSLLLTADGDVLSFGSGEEGELGLGDWNNAFVPTIVDTGDNTIAAIAAGGEYEREENSSWAYGRSFLVTSDGKVLAFGDAYAGALGLGEDWYDDINEPTLIETNMPPIKKVASGGNHTLLLAENGEVYGLGFNDNGQLGLNNDSERYGPTNLVRLTGAKGIAAGQYHSLAWFRADNSVISPVAASFDRYTNGQRTMEISLSLNGNMLKSITRGDGVLHEGMDYQLQGNKVILQPTYLSKLSVGSHTLTFVFTAGKPQTLTVGVTDSTPTGGGSDGGTGSGKGTDEDNGNDDDGDNESGGEGGNNEQSPEELQNKPRDIASHWAESVISQAIAAGIVKGYPDGSFKPDRVISRAEFAVMLAPALKLHAASSMPDFTDKAEIGLWARDAISQLFAENLLSGYPDGSFRPGKGLTRAELAVIVARVLKADDNSKAASKFTDAGSLPSWAIGAIGALSEKGILLGRSDGRFDPNGVATRAETVTILLRMMEQRQ
ncbi:X2-like carbohydrate binding domain-containing protein [Paenibacillus sp. PAMC21692]|uniref:RCC1 domain-containing protein n=1 Tax=Paenibacillus sp. PAMC21692 TaxID=2762320 RepID=UPI00164D9246|nr:X2-like carbohydrate binding domain-containing protein [Paenibacillus sp. PAMC21692]QNK59170.1 S-layer homology domain-containing protein [Paenibacillus sp. PAMC21692]